MTEGCGSKLRGTLGILVVFFLLFAVLMAGAAPVSSLSVCPSSQSRDCQQTGRCGSQSKGSSHGSSGGKVMMSLLVLTTSSLLPRHPFPPPPLMIHPPAQASTDDRAGLYSAFSCDQQFAVLI